MGVSTAAGAGSGRGGALQLDLGEPAREPWGDVLPTDGALVAFHSGRFHHEVVPAVRERHSPVGWPATR